MLWPRIKKRTARRSTNRKCLVPNEGGPGAAGAGVVFGVFESGVFGELAIELILTASVKFGAVPLEMQEAGELPSTVSMNWPT
jgi:hypothetical protein